MLTTEQLLKIEQDAQKATPGPWEIGVDMRGAKNWLIGPVTDDYKRAVTDGRHISNCDPQTVMELVKMARKSIELEAELSEQCRLLGAGSEREARLMARVAELEAINSQRKEGGEG